MIRPGRLRRAPAPTLTWHRRLAAERRRALRARRASWSALVAIVVAAALSPVTGSPWWGVPAGFVAGLVAALLPVRDADAWARRWITRQRGLGYETALAADGRDDPYGFWSRARERTLLAIRDAPRPKPARWWLPPSVATLLVLVAIAFLPSAALDLGGGPSRAADGARPSTTDRGDVASPEGAGPQPPPASDGSGTVAPGERGATELPDGAPAPEARDPSDRTEGEQGRDGDGGAGADGAGGSPVDRFLRDLDDAESEGDGNPFEPVQRPSGEGRDQAESPSSTDLGALEPSEGGDPDAADDAGASVEGGDPGSGSASTPGDGGEGADDDAGDDSDAAGGSPPSGDEGEEGSEAGSGDPGDDGDAPGGRADQGASGPGGDEGDAAEADAQRGDGEAPDAAGLSEGDDTSGGGAGSADDPARRAGAEGGSDGAGLSPGEDADVEPLPGAPEGPARRLPGDRDDGPVPVVGSVRGAGAPPDAVPEGRGVSAAEARSAERSAEEQGLPGAYREIIRRYFR